MSLSSDDTDEKILAGIGSEPELFGVLIDRYDAKLRRYIQRISAFRGEDLDDLMQDIFTKAYIHSSSFDQKLSFNSWIYRITHNQTINTWKKEKRRSHASFDDEMSQELISALVDDELQRYLNISSDKQLIQDALSGISLDDRSILTLRFFEERSYGEISDILKMPEGTVATKIFRAKKKLLREVQKLTKQS